MNFTIQANDTPNDDYLNMSKQSSELNFLNKLGNKQGKNLLRLQYSILYFYFKNIFLLQK